MKISDCTAKRSLSPQRREGRQDFKYFSNRFAFPAPIINFLRALRFFAVKGLFFSGLIREICG